MSGITVDYELVRQTCPQCQVEFEVSRGHLYQDGVPLGIYLAGMHGCNTRLVFLTIALLRGGDPATETLCVNLVGWATPTEYQSEVIDPAESPWQDETYLGPMLSREDALADPAMKFVFGAADRIVAYPPVSAYLEAPRGEP